MASVVDSIMRLRNRKERVVGPPGDTTFFQSLFSKVRGLAGLGEETDFPYKHSPWVYAANQAIAIPISSLPFRIFREEGRGRRSADARAVERRAAAILDAAPRLGRTAARGIAYDPNPRRRMMAIRNAAPTLPAHQLAAATTGVEVVETGPWVDLFTRVNPQMTRSVLWEATLIYLGTEGGECFWELVGKEGKVAENEIPLEIWPRSRTGWKPIFDEQGTEVIGWAFDVKFEGLTESNGKVKTARAKRVEKFENHQIIHLKWFNPRNPLAGLSPCDPVREEVHQGLFASRWNTNFFKNGASHGSVLSIKNESMSEEEAQDLLEKIEQRNVNVDNAHRILALFGAEAELMDLSRSQKDMDFIGLQNLVRDVIMGVHRVSKSALGMVEDQNRANLLGTLRNHWESTLIPRISYFEDLLESDLFTVERIGRETPVWGMFDLSVVEALQDNFGEKLDSAQKLVRMGYPINVVNERLELDMPTMPWGDAWYRPQTLVAETGEDPGGGTNGNDDDPNGGGTEPPAAEAIRMDEYMRGRLWDGYVRQLFEPNEAAYRKAYRGFVRGVKVAQLRKIRSQNVKEITVPEQLLFPLSEQQRIVSARMEPIYRKAFDDAQADAIFEAGRTLGTPVALSKQAPDSKNVFIVTMTEEVKQTVNTMRERMREIVAEALRREATQDEFEELARDFFSDFTSGGHVSTIARTEISTTVNTSRQMTFEDVGVERGEWITAADERVRDTHVTYGRSGPKPMGFNWATIVGGDYTLEYPLDTRAPLKERVNCRCVLIPV